MSTVRVFILYQFNKRGRKKNASSLFQFGMKNAFPSCCNPPVSRASGARRPSCLAFTVRRDPFTETSRAIFFFFLISRLSSFQETVHENESGLTTRRARGVVGGLQSRRREIRNLFCLSKKKIKKIKKIARYRH